MPAELRRRRSRPQTAGADGLAEASPSYLFVPELGEAGARVALSTEESHYLVRVCRAREGERATATDGRGAVATVRLISARGRATVEVESIERSIHSRPAWVWCGAPQGQRADWLVEKLAELGVESWQPLECERATWKAPARRAERWRRLALAALRQSRRRFLMEVREPLELVDALAQLPPRASLWLASHGGPAGARPAREAGLGVGAIGPAAGFTAAEERALEGAGFQPISLSDGRLRSETAALAWALWWTVP